jgi:hypothetical protein
MPILIPLEAKWESFPILTGVSLIFGNADPQIAPFELKCSECREHGIDHIIMDTGCGSTLLPYQFAESIGITEPIDEQDSYSVNLGVGGVNACFTPSTPISLTIRDNRSGESKCASILPSVCLGWATSFSAINHIKDPRHLKRDTIDFVKLPYTIRDDGFSAEIRVPDRVCSILNRRPRLNPNDSPLKWILIGRDWQKRFSLTFEDTFISIE